MIDKTIYTLQFDAGLRTLSEWRRACCFYAGSDKEAVCTVEDIFMGYVDGVWDEHADLVDNLKSKRTRLVKFLANDSYVIIESWD